MPRPLPLSKSKLSLSGFQTLKEWKLALGEVKLLYLQRRYKQCIARCDTLLDANEASAHEPHKAFIHFYSAICYESLGLLAHNYSVKKLSFLGSAREAFEATLNDLPNSTSQTSKPFVDLEDPFSDSVSPAQTSGEDEDVSTAVTTPLSASAPSPPPSPSLNRTTKTFPHSDTLADIENSLHFDPCIRLPQADTLADIEASLCPGNEQSSPLDKSLPSFASAIRASDTAHLAARNVAQKQGSRAHIDSPTLFPAPLKFKKGLPKFPGPPPARSLPPLPPVVVSPTPKQRKTGLVTSIDTLVTAQNAAKERLWCPVPDIFASDENKENVPPPGATPKARNQTSARSPLTERTRSKTRMQVPSPIDTSLANGGPKKTKWPHQVTNRNEHETRYASLLRDLTSQVTAHLSYIESIIVETNFLQQEHRRKKAQGEDGAEGRKASYWLLSSQATTNKVKGSKKETKGPELKEKIERLKKEGWRINKERKGWKGEEYYKNLREKAWAEMEILAVA
ncbi:MAG: hypothetical protein Q9160_006516 [Pyrenula sp. 1 TL-2023]